LLALDFVGPAKEFVVVVFDRLCFWSTALWCCFLFSRCAYRYVLRVVYCMLQWLLSHDQTA